MKGRKRSMKGTGVPSHRGVRGSRARIDRRGPSPAKAGRYRNPSDQRVPVRRFAPTAKGLSTSALRKAVLEELTRIITKD